MKSREAQEQAVVISWCEMQKSKYPELDMELESFKEGLRELNVEA